MELLENYLRGLLAEARGRRAVNSGDKVGVQQALAALEVAIQNTSELQEKLHLGQLLILKAELYRDGKLTPSDLKEARKLLVKALILARRQKSKALVDHAETRLRQLGF